VRTPSASIYRGSKAGASRLPRTRRPLRRL
jgi:hypothetical protein